ncbi:ubiquitin carboxyl-terminal hydrolase 32 isoform X1 [Glossina fuscipes]|uniref:ubiquitinyl hydrolase 1 n=1 Tax=Glossina fuscipes TaxID=7396 RepID=A0A9C5YY07_9MUSC|nr:ubiquitin carboxyl-terminal hydrolase 32 isoform X1 [Glossina fuscipes]
MGAKESKQSCINYEDAIKRVSEAEFRRLKDAFKKSAGVGRLYLSRNAFQQDVLCEGVPANVTDLLYTACGGTSKGISFKDLLCGLVLITRGTEEEKTKFLWNLYCNDSGSYILKIDFCKAINLHLHESASLFAQADRINFEQFEAWILRNRNSTVLAKWLLSDNCISLTSELETPTFYQSLAGVTHLEEKDIGDLEKEFWRLKNSSPNGQLDLQLIGPLLSPPIPKNALLGLFNSFDENWDGHIDFKELCCGVSAACRGPSVERTRFCFKIFDVDRDGVLNCKETLQMINVLLFVAKENRNDDMYKDVNREEALKDIANFAVKNSGQQPQTEINEEKNSVNEFNVSLTAEDFMMWNVESNLKLLQPFLDLIFEVCHIVFGLWPQCRHMECDIVRGWLEREEKRKYRVGQFWYLVSRDWWLNWLQYTSNTTNYCDYCKRSNAGQRGSNFNCGIDEALVCDESFNTNSLESVGDQIIIADNCSLGSASSGISTGRHLGSRPGPIDNMSLVTPNQYKNVRTLTGEGGHLKKDCPLVQNHDFELVPKSLWKALNRWYGDNLPLPRQVIQPPNSPDVELELYPLHLRILLHQNIPQNQSVNNWGSVSGGYGVMATSGGFAAISASSVLQPPKRYLAYTAAFSRLATVQQVGTFLCEQLRLRTEDVRLWHIPQGSLDNSAILLEEDSMMLKELLIKDNDQVLLEIRNKDQTWPEELGSLTLTQSGGNSIINDRRLTRTSIMSVQVPGATGLHNLGNTCFMNAALQVLFNTQPLAQYFRRNMHMFELNTTNKLGTRGHLATRYGELLKEVWSATTRSVAPLKLRFCVTKHAPQFAGGGQHDSQELLEWFLDALHEDLNRVMDKPYSELRDSNGRPDKIVAAEAWAQHHARNQSIIIDLFYGQLKSKVSCLCCGRESVRFDPFSLLSLPLPVENYIYFEVLVMLLDGSIPTKYGLRLNSESKYFDVKRQLAPYCHLNPNFMLICEVWNSQIRHVFSDDEKIRSSSAKELYVYQLPEESSDRSRSSSTLAVNIEKGLKDIQRNSVILTTQDFYPSLNMLTTATNNNNNNINNNNINNASNVTNANNCTLTTTAINANDKHNVIPPLNVDDDESLPVDTTAVTTIASIPTKCYQNKLNSVPNTICIAADDEDEEDEDVQVPTKVRRCFGNTMCMPQNLLCFKHSPHLSRSPEDVFVNCTLRKRISASKLLSKAESTATTTSIHSQENSLESCNDEAVVSGDELHESFRRMSDCPCRLNVDDDDKQKYISHDLHPESVNYLPPINSIADVGNGVFSRVPSQHFKVGKYLVAVHRKITRQDSYFLSHHKTRPSIFGIPLIIPNLEGGTHKDLYCAVWLQVSRLLSPLPASTDQANHAADCDDSLGYDFPFSLRAVKCDGLTCALCSWSNFCRGCEIPCNNDYVLQGLLFSNSNLNTSNNSTPKLLTKYSDSMPNLEGKKTYDRDSVQSQSLVPKNNENFTIAIDWDPTALHLRYQCTLERLWIDHETVAICRKEQIEPVDLNHCLKAFTSEEKLEQWYHCGHCRGKKPATKKLQIWKLPPILIVHLKRFNCVNGKWVKSQKVVHFPFDNFDPTPYLAAVPQETVLRHRELQEIRVVTESVPEENELMESTNEEFPIEGLTAQESQGNINGNESASISDLIIKHGQLSDVNNEQVNNIINLQNQTQLLDNCSNIVGCLNDSITINRKVEDNQKIENGQEKVLDNVSAMMANNLQSNDEIEDTQTMTRRRRLISTSLTKTPIIDGAFEDFHQHKLRAGEDNFDPKYRLYAVVSHSGMLNGGHYVSYAANTNGNWYCYNDSSCREISSQPNIDPSSAYLLFYERKGLDYEPYLPNIEGKAIHNGGLSILDIDETENDLKKMCAIS